MSKLLIANPALAMGQGAEAGAVVRDQRRQNDLAQLYQNQGSNIAAGESQALNQLAQIDPALAQEQQDKTRAASLQKAGIIAGAVRNATTPEEFEKATRTLVEMGAMSQEEIKNYKFGDIDTIVKTVQGVENQITNEQDFRNFNSGQQEFAQTFRQKKEEAIRNQNNFRENFVYREQQDDIQRINDNRDYDLKAKNLLYEQNQDKTNAENKRESDALIAQEQEKTAGAKRRTDQLDTETKLRKELNNLPPVKGFYQLSQAYSRIISSAKEPDGAGDMALIFNYMKLLDPKSVVKETEFDSARRAGAWLQKMEGTDTVVPREIVTAINKAIEGTILTTTQRNEIVSRSGKFYNAADRDIKKLNEQYTKLALEYGSRPEMVILDYSTTNIPNQDGVGQDGETPGSSRTIEGKDYVKINDQWFEKS